MSDSQKLYLIQVWKNEFESSPAKYLLLVVSKSKGIDRAFVPPLFRAGVKP